MYFDWLSDLNWVDLVFVIIFIRIVYIGLKNKLVIAFFKFLGILFAAFASLHYYSRLAQFVSDHSALPLDIAKDVSYIFIVFISILIFKLILEGVLLLFKIEPQGLLDRWGALLFSLLRGALICSLIGVFFAISAVNYLEFSVKQSFLGSRLTTLAPKSYKFLYVNIVSKLFPNEELNYDDILNVTEDMEDIDVTEDTELSGEEK